ncbi:hypothetical protein L6R53_02215 [Myxococcota bacterium]|nr:hypothetical protein [Myxococcota bacterium]
MTAALLVALVGPPALAEDPGPRDLEREEREEEEEEEGGQPAPAPTEEGPDGAELSRRVDVLAGEIERLRIGEAAVAADESVHGMGPAASKVYRGERGVSLGGYGEVKYHNYAAETQDGSESGAVDGMDVHRLILYAGYKFDDRWVLNTEIEFEHVKEVYVEFAYLDFQAAPQLGARAGLLLVPMGIYNELHEPTTFAAVERPRVEHDILPSTWREIGLGVYGEVGPISYRAYLLDGMHAGGFSASGLRGGRQKGAEAVAESFAGVARLDLTGVEGLVVGGSVLYGGAGQDLVDPTSGEDVSVNTLAYEGHVVVDLAGLKVRALYAGASVDGVPELNAALALTGADSVGETLSGYYGELGYDVFSPLGIEGQALIPHVRYEALDTQAGVPAGYSASAANDRSGLTFGLAYQPHRQISLKADYQLWMDQADTGVDQFNAGIGFIF